MESSEQGAGGSHDPWLCHCHPMSTSTEESRNLSTSRLQVTRTSQMLKLFLSLTLWVLGMVLMTQGGLCAGNVQLARERDRKKTVRCSRYKVAAGHGTSGHTTKHRKPHTWHSD